MGKHTPGPWTYDAAENGAWVYSGDDREIAYLSTDERDDLPPIPAAEIRANARLIAAAPDLLEALRALVDWFPANAEHSQALNNALDAIAKVEGGQK